MFKKIAVALAFSPYSENLLIEAIKLKTLFNAELNIIHIGDKSGHESARQKIDDLLRHVKAPASEINVLLEKGSPSRKILGICKKRHIDLLICGALKREDLLHYYIGSVSRKILRKSTCSVLVLLASNEKAGFKRITVDCNEENKIKKTLDTAFYLGYKKESSQMHLVRELKLYGLTMAMEEYAEDGYTDVKKAHIEESIREVEKMLAGVDTHNLKINIKITGGKPGYELAKFIRASFSDLLVASTPDHKLGFLDRVFPHHLEYLFANLPCNILLVQ